MSLNSLINTARSALAASQLGIQVAGHNIANAKTEGYSRQRVDLVSLPGVRTNLGYTGNGVQIAGWDRVRDTLADATFRREHSMLEEYNQRFSTLSQIEAALSDMSKAGITDAFTGFFDAWSDLATNPSGAEQREQVRQRANVLVQRFNNLDSRMDGLVAEMESVVKGDISRLNEITKEIANLNRAIVTAESNGKSAPDLRDARDRALDKVAGMIQIRSVEQQDGSVTVVSGSAVLVDRNTAHPVESFWDGTKYHLRDVGSGTPMQASGGKIGGALDLLNNDFPSFRAQVDAVVAEMVAQVNAIHMSGTTMGGATGIEFFDPSGLTAGGLRLSTSILANRDNVVSGLTTKAGDGDVANSLEQLRYTGLSAFGGDTLMEAQLGVAVGIGLKIDNARDVSEAQRFLVESLALQRTSVSGVSTEEEMTSIMQFQHAYQAASSVIRSADEMMRAILELV